MRCPASRTITVVTVALLATIPLCAAPIATAVSPPAIDDTFLPKPHPPAPPQQTKQREQCFVPTAGPANGSVAVQLKDIDLPTVWQLARGAGQTVAVIDTGVSRHRLLPRLIPGGDYVFTGDGTADCDGHGTIVAGIIAAAADSDNSNAFSGVAPDAAVISIRQSSNKFGPVAEPSTSGYGDVDTLAMAVRTAADLGATVINVSSVACVPVADALDDRALGAALAYAVDVKNVVVVAAAGNVGGPGQCPEQNPGDDTRPGEPSWDTVKVVVSPAWYDQYVLTVGSVAPNGAPSRFSLAGPWVDVAAPGEAIVSLDPDGEGLVDALPATRRLDTDLGDQLRRTRRERSCRAGARTISASDRPAGHAAHRRHRAPSRRGLGFRRGSRRGRCAGRGERRIGFETRAARATFRYTAGRRTTRRPAAPASRLRRHGDLRRGGGRGGRCDGVGRPVTTTARRRHAQLMRPGC